MRSHPQLLLLLLSLWGVIWYASGMCSKPGKPANGKRQLSREGSRRVVTYTCETGYRLVGRRSRRCLGNSKNGFNWEGKKPKCIERSCSALPDPVNGDVNLRNGRATYSCRLSYRLVGSAFRVCTNSRWSGTAPSCRAVTCPQLSSLAFGRITLPSSGKFAVYICNKEYKLTGNAIRVCRGDRWSGSKPRLRKGLNRPTNGFLQVSGDTATYSCAVGFNLDGNRNRRCQTGVWSGTDPSCVRITVCERLRDPANGDVRLSRNNNNATYICNSGYTLVGNQQRTCSNGDWSGMQPSCVQNCPRLDRPENGNVDQMRNSATYSCNSGYELRGRTSVCIDGDEWRDRCNQLCTCVGGRPQCCRERKDIESMTTAEKRLYVDTLIISSTDARYRQEYEDFLGIQRLQFFSGIHERNQFLPWHR
ncbi:CUB and sushi domain-containing protein 1-like [Corticium candelabrum]|uniref:CUB and sushi domain-containing protein 1-like n=1 Tax=Corticium candelabrum TaxID=121492 RepID=UPI002E25FE8F|nr:CUB and sushi domain-containing protein 1-like [Corticium candelabrum]